MPRPKKILKTKSYPATWLLPSGLGDEIWRRARRGSSAPDWFDAAVQSAVSEYLRYCSEIEDSLDLETYRKKVFKLCRLIDEADDLLASLSQSERAEVRAALPWPESIRRNPFNPANDPDDLLQTVLQQAREFSARLRERFQSLPVLEEERTSGGSGDAETFERRFDRLVKCFIPIAERIPVKVSASKDSSGVSPFVALIEASLRVYLEEHSEGVRKSISEKHSQMFTEVGMEQQEIDRLSKIWDRGFDFGKAILAMHSSSTGALADAISSSLRILREDKRGK